MIKRALILFIIVFILNACERFPGHYIALNQCLQENTAVGEELLVAYAELEEYLLNENLLEGTEPSHYTTLLTEVAQGNVVISARDVAPHVRDFWGMEEAATFGAYMRCTDQLSGTLGESEAASIHQLYKVHQQMLDTRTFKDAILLSDLTAAIDRDDFKYILYRSVLLNMLVFMME